MKKTALIWIIISLFMIVALAFVVACTTKKVWVGERSKTAPAESREPRERVGLDTEIWVIKKAEEAQPARREEASPQLRAILPGEEKEIPLPLEKTDVRARISGYVATVDVLQKYHNPYQAKIEAVYVFPLPTSAAVTDFVMVVGDRKIRGLIREKEEAQRIYEEAKRQGYRAALLTQTRPNIFKQKVANIEPSKRIDIRISFFNPLQYKDGEFEFVFPTVVGPRFNPPGYSGGVGAIGRRGKPGRTKQPTEVRYLRPGEKSGYHMAITVDVDAIVTLEKVYSRSHVIRVTRKGPSRATVTLSPNDTAPDKDFVLRYRTAGRAVKTAIMVQKGRDGNYFSLLLQPPENLKDLPRIPREMVFVLDCSGSMSGRPLSKAKDAIRRCLYNLDGNDTFQIIRFSSNASSLGPAPIPATPANVRRGVRYLDSLKSGGGTMMIEGIKAALDFPHDEGRLRIVSFMTDGYIGNETEILAEVKRKVGASRIFSFGIGTSVNRYLLERLAKIGRGAAAYFGPNDSVGKRVDQFYERASKPALADIKIQWGALEVSDVYPRKIPDLFVGRPVVITGKFKKHSPTEIKISGQAGKERRTYSVSTNPDASKADHKGIRSVWARWKIAELSDEEIYHSSNELRNEIISTSINYSVLSRYTAFLSVDSQERTRGDHGYTVDVPVPVPEGVIYSTTVKE